MLRALRFRLSLLYLAASLSLVALVAASSYGLLALYFLRSTDLALQYKMATEFRLRGLPVPAELVAAEHAWIENGGRQPAPRLTATNTPAVVAGSEPTLLASPDPIFEFGPTSQPQVELGPTSQPETEPEDESESESEADPQPPPQPGSEPESGNESESESEAEPQPQFESSSETESEDESESDAQPQSTSESEARPQPSTGSGIESQSSPQPQPESESESDIEDQSTSQLEAFSGSGTVPQAAADKLQPTPESSGPEEEESDDRYDSRLAPVFVVPEEGSAASAGIPVLRDTEAAAQALRAGSDVRTIALSDGNRLRLLSYRTGEGSVLQVGRLLSDQDRLLAQFLLGLVALGSTASVVLAFASWMLAGRTIRPAQQAMDQQQQFVSNASHELRAPLTLLRASADYALRTRATPEREQSLRDILDECDYMDRLVEDLLLLTRLDARRLTLAAEIVPLAELLPEIARQVERVSAAKGVTLELGGAVGDVRGDRARLRQALLILLDNALRFTPAGGRIRLEALTRGQEVAVVVTDSGVGIAAEHLPRIFDRFYQVPGQADERRGNGLGLSIARGLIEAHHGRMSVSSRPGSGPGGSDPAADQASNRVRRANLTVRVLTMVT
jgi:signal transduction histidine kinase